MYRLRRCFTCAPTPHSTGGIQARSGAERFALPLSTQPPRPLALSLYGGLPITTVIGSALFIWLAERRDAAKGDRTWGMYSYSSLGLPSVSVRNRRRSICSGSVVFAL